MDKYKICCITYKELDRLVREAVSQIEDSEIEVVIIEGLREEIIEKVKVATLEGIEIVIAGGANAKIAKDFCDIPVIDYNLTAYDYLEAINKAFILGKSIAMATYRYPIESALCRYIEKIGIDYSNIIYENTQDLEEQILSCNADVIIGAAHSVEIATKLGKKNVLIYPGKEGIKDTIFQAKELAVKLRQANEKSKFVQAVIHYSANGIILTDIEGRIIDFNKSAQRLLKKDIKKVKGKLAYEVIPECEVDRFIESGQNQQTQINTICGKELVQTWVRLTVNHGLFIGAVGVIYSISEINKAQLRYQEKQRMEKGFIAKTCFKDIAGNSFVIKAAIEEARFFAESDANVLLYGETGVGKEVFAQSIHNASGRKDGPFIAINCAALPENLLESELFGYDEGAFTGSKKGGKKGFFELASGGTIFLDEIGEISPVLQVRLLRVLQEKEIIRVGGDRVIPVDARVISATNKNLENMSPERWRQDLYYRLSVLELRIPPLRDRKNDVMILFELFYKMKSSIENYNISFSETFSKIIQLYSWPGNIRELENICERFSLYIGKNNDINEKFIIRCIIRAIGEERLLKDILKKYEPLEKNLNNQLIELLQEVFSYNKEQVAQKLGVSRTTLWRITKT